MGGCILLEQVSCGAHVYHAADAGILAVGARTAGLATVAQFNAGQCFAGAVGKPQCLCLRDAAAQRRPSLAGRQRSRP